MSAISVSIDNKIYGNDTCAIANLGFKVEQSEFVALIGPSGAGKTTLLNIIAGIDTQYEGEVLLTNSAQNQKSNIQAAISFMFQDARLLPWLTVGQNIQLVMADTEQDNRAIMLDLLQQVRLKDVIDQYPEQLSGGMKRRVSMARAFVNQPQLLLMDEPFQSLDEPTANGLRTMLLELWTQTRPTVLFVTHSLREALAVADRILFLSDRPAQLMLDYKVDASRPRQLEDTAVTALHAQLLSQYPNLLSGLL